MRIALVGFEFEGARSGGGIGTYIRNAAAMLAARGHDIEVFAASNPSGSTPSTPNFMLHGIETSREEFRFRVLEPFSQRQQSKPFDVIEGPEFGADAAFIAAKYPALPLVVKLHAPTFTIQASNRHYVGVKRRLRFAFGAIRRGRWPQDPYRYRPEVDLERLHTREADEVVGNSQATADRARACWNLADDRLSSVPLAFDAPQRLLAIDHLPRTDRAPLVLFLGRIEVRKGVIELAHAIPKVLAKMPSARFRFVGRITVHPNDDRLVSDHIRELTSDHADRVEIIDGIPYDDIPEQLADADVCVFPSDWEAAGYTCLEAMAAGRAIIASKAGGMMEMIGDGRNGVLVPRRNPGAIADKILALLGAPHLRGKLGAAARIAVQEKFSHEAVAPLQLQSYERAIAAAARRDPRMRFR